VDGGSLRTLFQKHGLGMVRQLMAQLPTLDSLGPQPSPMPRTVPTAGRTPRYKATHGDIVARGRPFPIATGAAARSGRRQSATMLLPLTLKRPGDHFESFGIESRSGSVGFPPQGDQLHTSLSHFDDMPAPRHLRNAPIVEALLDIQVVPRADARFEDLVPLLDAYQPQYKKVADKRAAEFQVEINASLPEAEAKARSTSLPVGFMLASENGRSRVQVAINEFTQNVLGQYADFDSLVAEAKPNWEIFRGKFGPLSISRIALRYINDLRLPLEMAQFEDYLPVMPSIPAALPQGLSDFVFRMTIDNPAVDAKAVVNQMFQGEINEKGVRVILDIDAIIEKQIDTDDARLWDRFSDLRKFKNDIFFNFVTERLLERYE